jgi:hypothetical protein
VLHDARFLTEIAGVKFMRADMKRSALGFTLSPEQDAWRKSGMTSPRPPDGEARSIYDSTFDRADMEQSVFMNALIYRNSFKCAMMSGVTFLNVRIGGDNRFVEADLSEARFYGVTFLRNIKEKISDFTDANLSKLQIGQDLATENDFPKEGAILCRTKFSAGPSNRDCALSG